MLLQPYINFNGTCAEAFRFYETTLGGKIEMMMTYGESPMGGQTPPEAKDRILHATLRVGDEIVMGSDAPAETDEKAQGMWVSLSVTDAGEAERIYHAFAEGGAVTMPLGKTFWSERFGMVTDRFGTPWMINCAPGA